MWFFLSSVEKDVDMLKDTLKAIENTCENSLDTLFIPYSHVLQPYLCKHNVKLLYNEFYEEFQLNKVDECKIKDICEAKKIQAAYILNEPNMEGYRNQKLSANQIVIRPFTSTLINKAILQDEAKRLECNRSMTINRIKGIRFRDQIYSIFIRNIL